MYGSFYIVDVDKVKHLLENMEGIEYSLVVHDRDSCNKAHLHLVVKSLTANYLNVAVFKKLFPVGYMEECHSYEASLLYLLHRGHDFKASYDVDELFTNIDYYDRFPFLKKEVI